MSFTISMTETDLIQGCIANDRLAQKRLYDKYKRGMYTVAYRITGDFDLANDALQEGFIQVFRGLPKFRAESTLGAWIKTIIVRAALKVVKKKVHFEPIEDYNTGTGFIDWGDYLSTEYLEKAIMSLPEGYRAVFTLVEIEGYQHKEVAEMLGISAGTSKSQLFHAKKRLRETLKNFDY